MRPFSCRAGHRLAPYLLEYRRLVVTCLRELQGFLDACDEEAFDPSRCGGHLMAYLGAMMELHVLWRRDLPPDQHAAMPWHLRPKCHMLEHIALDQLRR